MRNRLDEPDCRRGPRRSIGDRLAVALRALRRTGRGKRRCEVRPDWLDDDGLESAMVPRRPRGPRFGGAVALELPKPVDEGWS
jgi:hypothetical protein